MALAHRTEGGFQGFFAEDRPDNFPLTSLTFTGKQLVLPVRFTCTCNHIHLSTYCTCNQIDLLRWYVFYVYFIVEFATGMYHLIVYLFIYSQSS